MRDDHKLCFPPEFEFDLLPPSPPTCRAGTTAIGIEYIAQARAGGTENSNAPSFLKAIANVRSNYFLFKSQPHESLSPFAIHVGNRLLLAITISVEVGGHRISRSKSLTLPWRARIPF